jgi:hypothetical protein
MEFLLSHWHCILPVIAIALVLLLRGRGGKKDEKVKRGFVKETKE